MAGGLARTTAFWPVRPSAGAARMSLEGRLRSISPFNANGWDGWKADTHASQQESSIRSRRRRERLIRAAVAGRVAVQFFRSRQTQIPLGVGQAIRQD